MEKRRCSGCMQFVEGPVCPHCGTAAAEENAPGLLKVGSQLKGRYLIGKCREQDDRSATYVALDQKHDQTVWLLELYPRRETRREGNQLLGERLARDVEALEKKAAFTQEPKLFRYGFGLVATFRENNTFYQVLDPCGTLKLGEYLQMRGGKLSSEETGRLLGNLLDTLAALHRQGRAHGAISPESVVIDSMAGARFQGLGSSRADFPRQDMDAISALVSLCLTGGTAAAGSFNSVQELKNALASNAVGAAPVAPKGPKAPPQQPVDLGPTGPVKPIGFEINDDIPVSGGTDGKGGKPKGLIIGLIAAVLVIALAIAGYFTVHIWGEGGDCEHPAACTLCGKLKSEPASHSWQEATCRDPKTCSVCGAVEGQPKDHVWVGGGCVSPSSCSVCGATEFVGTGHNWKDATCSESKVCTDCGETEGEPLGHDWKDASQTEPKTCRRCGATEGQPKGGYVEDVPGDWERFYWDNASTHCYAFDTPYSSVTSFTLEFLPEFNSGVYVEHWKVMYRDLSGVWHELERISLDGSGAAVETFYFDTPTGISAVAVIPAVSGGYSYSFYLSIVDLYYNK